MEHKISDRWSWLLTTQTISKLLHPATTPHSNWLPPRENYDQWSDHFIRHWTEELRRQEVIIERVHFQVVFWHLERDKSRIKLSTDVSVPPLNSSTYPFEKSISEAETIILSRVEMIYFRYKRINDDYRVDIVVPRSWSTTSRPHMRLIVAPCFQLDSLIGFCHGIRSLSDLHFLL